MNKQSSAALFLVAGIFGAALAGCEGESNVPSSIIGSEDGNLSVTVLSAETIAQIPSDSRLMLRLRGIDDAIVVDPSFGPIDFDRVDLSCPTAQMALGPWVTALAEDGTNKQITMGLFAIGIDAANTVSALNSYNAPSPGSYAPQVGVGMQCCENACGTTGKSDVVGCNCTLWAEECP